MVHGGQSQVLMYSITDTTLSEDGLNAARIATQVLFGTDYTVLKADQIIKSLSGNPRLVFCTEEEMFNTSLPNLVAKLQLVSSKCKSGT